ncbi:MAG: ABC transporter permease [bacterium]|nr:ABC transporter permease [bacterium]
MGKFIIKRLGQIIVTLFIIMTLLFILFRVMPGDPAAMILDPKMPPEAKALIRQQFGLDKPLIVQYGYYLKNVFTLNFGHSFYYPEPVFDLVMEKLPNTILLFTTAVFLSYLIGLPLGKYIAWRRGSRMEIGITVFGLFFYTIFIPWFGLIMIWIFSYKFGWFPLAGMLTPEVWADKTIGILPRIVDVSYHLCLPLGVLTLLFFAGSMLLMRNSMLETLREDYITTARAKGLDEKTVRDRHAARNAMLPVVTALTLSLAFSINGGVLTEKVFSWPGIGKLLIEAVLSHDYPLAQTAFLFLSIVVLLANLIADVLYAYLDPRIRY